MFRFDFDNAIGAVQDCRPQLRQYLGTYDVTSDGQRFLLGECLDESANAIPTVILNWTGIRPRQWHRVIVHATRAKRGQPKTSCEAPPPSADRQPTGT